MKKLLLILCTIFVVCASLTAQEEEAAKPFQDHVLTMLGFKALQIEEEDYVLSPSVNLQYMHIKNEGIVSKQPDAIVIGAGYSLDHYTKGLGPDEVANFHGINLMGNVAAGKNSFMVMLASSGEVPFSSINTITAGLMYTRQLVNTDNMSFTAGAGVIAGDLGLKIKDFDIYCVPLPLFSFDYHNDYFAGGVSMMGLPTVSILLFPKAPVRFNGNCGMAGFSSIRDLTFDCALTGYPLWNTKVKELIAVSAGVMNTVKTSVLKDKTKYSYQYYSVYGEINATFVTFRCGYNFNGEKRIDKDVNGDMYKGLFASAQAMFMF